MAIVMTARVDPRRVECIVHGSDQLGETPLWCDRERKLWWLDIERAKLHSLDPSSGARETVAFDTPFLGSQALGDDGAQLLALGLSLYRRDPASGALSLLARVEHDIDNRLNDGRVDARGRFWVGTMDNDLQRPNGALYRVDPDGYVQRMFDDVIVANGIAFSPNGKTMLFTDTRRRCTWRFDVDLDDGTLSNRRLFADHRASGERPDGACVDVDGCFWIAFFAGRRVVRYRLDSAIDLVVPMPVTNPTCVGFGGDDLRTLYVTSATKFLTTEQRAAEPMAGSVFAIHGLAQGLPEHRFAFGRQGIKDRREITSPDR